MGGIEVSSSSVIDESILLSVCGSFDSESKLFESDSVFTLPPHDDNKNKEINVKANSLILIIFSTS
jgi:hypothetical protein